MHGYPRRRIINGIIKLIAFLLILFICFQAIYNITKRKYSYVKSNDFFSQNQDFDVLFLGSSHMLNSIFPMQLWKDYGIISYNMANGAERLPTSYYILQLANKYTNPKLVVIDALYVDSDEKISYTSAHNSLDAFPISYTKYLAIKDLYQKENLLNNYFEFLFNFSIYHNRWNELTNEDFLNLNNYEKGAVSNINVAVPNKMSDFSSIDAYEGEETINMQYLRKMIEYCKERNIDVLVTYMPFPATDSQISTSKYVQTICDEYDVNYINFLDSDIVDFTIDCSDVDSHLNPAGSSKITKYIGNYIMNNYNIPDQRENTDYEFWYEDYNEYVDYKITNLKNNSENLNNYLMLLYQEKDINYNIVISNENVINEDNVTKKLLENLGNNYKIDSKTFEENKDKTIKITTYDNRNQEEIQTIWF